MSAVSGLCGSRLVVSNPTSHGVTYEYLTCLDRHSKRVPHCPFKSPFTYQIEDEILRLYERIHLSSNFRQDLERRLIDQLAIFQAESRQEMEDVSMQKTVIERQLKKLLGPTTTTSSLWTSCAPSRNASPKS